MNPLRAFCLVALLVAAACGSPSPKQQDNAGSNNLKPSQWLSASKLESVPSIDQVTLQQLENMSLDQGAQLIEQFYHLSQPNHELQPNFVPSPSNIPVTIFKNNGQSTTTNLNEMVQTVKQQPNFGDQEVTIYITGLPQTIQTVLKANKKLVQAYMQRYNGQNQAANNNNNNRDYDYGNEQGQGNQERTSSEEDNNESQKNTNTNGDLVIINLGATITDLNRFALLDVEQTGKMIGKMLAQLTDEADVPQEIIHIVAQGIGAQVAGAAGRQYKRLTGQQLRRITGLDPAKMFAKNPNMVTGLARADADFVDVIHTSAYGMGTVTRCGDIDFYPNGPSAGVPGAKNVIEAAMRAVRYFAESVRPGNERNFPAVAANSVQQYKSNNGNGPLAFMGIDTEYDQQGDYILQVNPNAPFGQRAPAQRQNTYHGANKAWKNSKDYE